MTTYTLDQATPNSSSFTIAETTTVCVSVTGASQLNGVEFIALQVDVGGSAFEDFNINFKAGSLFDVSLKPGIYRFQLNNADSKSTAVLFASPTS